MVADILEDIIIPSVQAVAGWFVEVLDAIEGKEFYIAMVFIALSCGFLLSNFRNGMRVGSDLADKAATRYVRRHSETEE